MMRIEGDGPNDSQTDDRTDQRVTLIQRKYEGWPAAGNALWFLRAVKGTPTDVDGWEIIRTLDVGETAWVLVKYRWIALFLGWPVKVKNLGNGSYAVSLPFLPLFWRAPRQAEHTATITEVTTSVTSYFRGDPKYGVHARSDTTSVCTAVRMLVINFKP